MDVGLLMCPQRINSTNEKIEGVQYPQISSVRALDMSGPVVAGRYAAGGRVPARQAVGSCRGSHHPVHPSATT
eukprot:1877520-Pleurochrysis_carterae.AAC.2